MRLPHVYLWTGSHWPHFQSNLHERSRLFGAKAPIQDTAQRCLVAVRSCSRITQLGNQAEWWAVVASGDVWSNTTPDLLYLMGRTPIPPASSLPSFGAPWLSKSNLPSELDLSFNLDGWRWVIFEATDQSCYPHCFWLQLTNTPGCHLPFAN